MMIYTHYSINVKVIRIREGCKNRSRIDGKIPALSKRYFIKTLIPALCAGICLYKKTLLE